MSAHETIATLSSALISDDRVLNPSERDLLANLIQRANHNPEDNIVPDAIARLVGEIVSERAHQVLGSCITQQLLKQLTRPTSNRTTPMKLGGPPPVLPPGPSPQSPRPPGPTPGKTAILDLETASVGIARTEKPMKLGGPPPVLPPGPSPQSPRPPGPTPGKVTILDLEATASVVTSPEELSILPAPCVLLDEFLAPEELQELMRDTLKREMEFQISEVIAPGVPGGVADFDHRRSRVLMDLGRAREVLLGRLQGCLPGVLRKLGQDSFRPSHAEMQITASNDGDFFHWHSDNADETIASREITFVYFFHREPKQFRGGELRIYDSRWENGACFPTENYRAIVPRQNQVVLFASSLTHEITPVECPSKAFADSRFTVNGWFHR
jgi:hypothetical protein